jgi:transcription antitermination factor NusA-like protein
MKTISVELEPELIKETISALNAKAQRVRVARAEYDRELETILSRVKSLESAIGKNGKNENPLPTTPGTALEVKPVEVTESGRRPYGASSQTMLNVLKGANGGFMSTKTIVELSGTAYGSAYRILRAFLKEKKVRRNDKGEWALS